VSTDSPPRADLQQRATPSDVDKFDPELCGKLTSGFLGPYRLNARRLLVQSGKIAYVRDRSADRVRRLASASARNR